MDISIKILKALSDKNRLRIFLALRIYDELCACEITELLQVSGATVSKHLNILVNANILNSRKDGRWVYYKINNKDKKLEGIFEWIENQMGNTDEILEDKISLQKIKECNPEDICRKQRGSKCC